MRVSKIRWVSHSKSTILSVDVQPSGYRFITGGADAYVRIWNLMPVVSYNHEMEGEEDEEDQEGEEDSQVIAGADEHGLDELLELGRRTCTHVRRQLAHLVVLLPEALLVV